MLSSVPSLRSQTRYGPVPEPTCPTLLAAQFDAAVNVLRPALLEQALLQCRYDDAQDCVAEGVALGLFNLAQFQVPGRWDSGIAGFVCEDDWRSALACWLRRILANVIAGFFRKQTRRGERVFVEDDLPLDLQAEHDQAQRDAEHALALHDELYSRLGQVELTELQDACVRRYLGGNTQEAIAQELNIGRRMVGYHIEAACKRLRKPGDLDISKYMWLLFVDCSFHAQYTKPADIWPDWMQQHPPDINLSAWIRAQERRQTAQQKQKSSASDTGPTTGGHE